MSRKSILVISPEWVGDAVMSLPALQLLRQQEPDTQIFMLARPEQQEFWTLCPVLDVILPWTGLFETVRTVKQACFDCAYVLSDTVLAACVPALAVIPLRAGTKNVRQQLLLTDLAHLPDGHRQFDFMSILEVQGEPPAPQLNVTDHAFRNLERKLMHLPKIGRALVSIFQGFESDRPSGSRPVVTVLPGAAHAPSQGWPQEEFVQLVQTLRAETDAVVLLTGAAGAVTVCEKTAAKFGDQVVDLSARLTWPEMAALLKRSFCVAGNATAELYLAAALGAPVVVTGTLADPKKNSPLGSVACSELENIGEAMAALQKNFG